MAGRWVAACAAGVAAAAALAAGAGLAATPVPTLKASALVLATTDLHGATAAYQGGSATIYDRELVTYPAFGKSKFDDVNSVAQVVPSVTLAQQYVASALRTSSTARGRAALAQQVFGVSKSKGDVKVAVRAPKPVALGDQAFVLSGHATAVGYAQDLGVLVLRVDRVVEIVTAAGRGAAVSQPDLVRLGEILVPRIQAALAAAEPAPPANTGAPTVSGAPQVGSALTLLPGTWSGAPSTYTYQWQRCDATGASCTDVAGATLPTYTVAAADVGDTLRAEVTAHNAGGGTQAASAATAVVQ